MTIDPVKWVRHGLTAAAMIGAPWWPSVSFFLAGGALMLWVVCLKRDAGIEWWETV